MYGLTEVYGPATVAAHQPDWSSLPVEESAALTARQGVPLRTLEDARTAEPKSGRILPADGESLGEVVLRGNTVMVGYLNNPVATASAFRHGWFRTGDLGVQHADGYIELKDRLKDNISSIEVEAALLVHPAIREAAVVAQPDTRWGETPCAFIAVRNGYPAPTSGDITAWCRSRLAHFKLPKRFVFTSVDRTSTGKIQKHLLREWARLLGPEQGWPTTKKNDAFAHGAPIAYSVRCAEQDRPFRLEDFCSAGPDTTLLAISDLPPNESLLARSI